MANKKLRIIQCPTLSSDEFKEVKEWLLSDKTWMIQKFGAWQTLKVYLTDEETFNLKLKFRGINISG